MHACDHFGDSELQPLITPWLKLKALAQVNSSYARTIFTSFPLKYCKLTMSIYSYYYISQQPQVWAITTTTFPQEYTHIITDYYNGLLILPTDGTCWVLTVTALFAALNYTFMSDIDFLGLQLFPIGALIIVLVGNILRMRIF